MADLSAHVKGLVKVMFETFPQWEQFVSASVASAARRSAEESLLQRLGGGGRIFSPEQ